MKRPDIDRDRVALFIAYALLVFGIAWSTYVTSRALDDVEENICATAEIAVANEIFTVAIFGQQADVSDENTRVAIDTYLQLAQVLDERCGTIFLDAIELPDVSTP